jgi:hypothetical protein
MISPHDSVYFNIKPKLHQKNLPKAKATQIYWLPDRESGIPVLRLIGCTAVS